MDKQAIISLLELSLAPLGYAVVDVDVRIGKNGLLRVYIERIGDADERVTLGDCELAGEQLSTLLDVENPLPGHYTLEVSSPGVDRRLRTAEHFERFAGSEIRLELKRASDGQRRFRGRLDGVDGDEILLAENGRAWRFRLEDIAEARLAGVGDAGG